MAYINFDVRRPTIGLHASGHSERREWSVGFELYFGGWHETVRLTTEEKTLDKLDGKLGFAVRTDDVPEGVKGQLYYSPQWDDPIMGRPANYSVSLWLAREEMARLIDLVQSGVPLTKVSVDAGEGVKYGWEPDGAGKDWDNEAHAEVPISGFSLQFGSDEESGDEYAEPPLTIHDEPGEYDTFKGDVLAKLSELNTRLLWIFGGLAALIAATLAHR